MFNRCQWCFLFLIWLVICVITAPTIWASDELPQNFPSGQIDNERKICEEEIADLIQDLRLMGTAQIESSTQVSEARRVLVKRKKNKLQKLFSKLSQYYEHIEESPELVYDGFVPGNEKFYDWFNGSGDDSNDSVPGLGYVEDCFGFEITVLGEGDVTFGGKTKVEEESTPSRTKE